MKTTPQRYYTPRQGQIPVFLSDFLSISDPVLAFDRFMEGIDLSKYLKNIPEYITGRNRYNPVLFLLEYDGKYQAVAGYKEAAGSGKAAFKVDRYYRTEWLAEEELPLHLEGLTIDAVYENLIRRIAGNSLSSGEDTTLKESVEQQKHREQLEKQIATLGVKMKKEKQLNRKMELKAEIKKLAKEWSVKSGE